MSLYVQCNSHKKISFLYYSDWNLTVVDKQYDPTSHKVFVHVRWELPFSHMGIKQMLIWYNLDHSDQVDAGRTGHIPKAAESTSEILKLNPNSEYSLLVSINLLFCSLLNLYYLMHFTEL